MHVHRRLLQIIKGTLRFNQSEQTPLPGQAWEQEPSCCSSAGQGQLCPRVASFSSIECCMPRYDSTANRLRER